MHTFILFLANISSFNISDYHLIFFNLELEFQGCICMYCLEIDNSLPISFFMGGGEGGGGGGSRVTDWVAITS